MLHQLFLAVIMFQFAMKLKGRLKKAIFTNAH